MQQTVAQLEDWIGVVAEFATTEAFLEALVFDTRKVCIRVLGPQAL